MSLKFATLDVFTSIAYEGNPLAVIHVPLDSRSKISQEQKQRIAAEFNLSESVFLHEQNEEEKQSGDVKIDIFTPYAEVPFAGHPTVGVSNYLLRYLKDDPKWTGVRALMAKAGRMPVEFVSSLPGTADVAGVQLAVAHNVHRHENRLGNSEVIPKLPADARKGFDIANYPIVSSVKGMTVILAQLDSLEDLKDRPIENVLGTRNTYRSQHLLDEGWQTGPIATYFFVDLGKDTSGVRMLRTRMLSMREDPATGSAASALCSHLSLTEPGEEVRRYKVTQGVEMGRRSEIALEIKLKSDGSAIEQLLLSGSAVKVMEGTVELPRV